MIYERTDALLAMTAGRLWLTDAGLETEMVFNHGLDLPQFAAFPLLDSEAGRRAMSSYFHGFMDAADRLGTGFILDTATWRANDGWGAVMGLSPADIAAANRKAMEFARGLRADRRAGGGPVLINGVCGPHGDGYAPDRMLTAAEARAYYAPQVDVLAREGADMISGVTLSGAGQATGIAEAARAAGLPVVLSFTVETDGRLADGRTLGEVIGETDAATDGYPAWFMINCAHPDHFRGALQGDWTSRIGSIRANASRKSHAELDNSDALDAGDPDELARDYRELMTLLPGLRVVGGCCGTGLAHVRAIGLACSHHAHAA